MFVSDLLLKHTSVDPIAVVWVMRNNTMLAGFPWAYHRSESSRNINEDLYVDSNRYRGTPGQSPQLLTLKSWLPYELIVSYMLK